jgi:hypothetical protein
MNKRKNRLANRRAPVPADVLVRRLFMGQQ